MAEFSFKNIFLAGVGATAYSFEKAQELVDDLVKKGELTVQQGKVVNEELKHNMSEKLRAAADSIENAGKKAADAASDVIENAAGKAGGLLDKVADMTGRGARRAEGKAAGAGPAGRRNEERRISRWQSCGKALPRKESPAAEKRAAGCMRL